MISNILQDNSVYKKIVTQIGLDLASELFHMVAIDRKNKAVQSVAMQLGLSMGKRARIAFKDGFNAIVECKNLGLYELVVTDTSIYLRPQIVFDATELFFLHTKVEENHELVKPSTKSMVGKHHDYEPKINIEALEVLNNVGFELDMDIVTNFEGENMPETSDEVIASLIGKEFFFDWKYDNRGRSYSSGYGIDIQGNKTLRSYLSLSNKEYITDIEPLWIALANAYGLDKLTWQERIDWAKEQEVGYTVTVPNGCERPAQYVKTIRAILDYQEGNESGYLMELDGTSSGLQIMATITGNMQLAKLVNLVNTGKREDFYTHIT